MDKGSSSSLCTAEKSSLDAMTAWNILTCNEGINLVNWRVHGVGNDLYWPPNVARGFTRESVIRGSLRYCGYLDALGLYGVPRRRDEVREYDGRTK